MRQGYVKMRRASLLFAMVVATGLQSCGGGDGYGSGSSVGIVDSFGQPVATSDSSGVGPGDSGADGTAGEGKPIPNALITLTDSNSRSVTATTDISGYYRAKITGMTPPFVAKVTKADGSEWHSLSTANLKVNGFITVNVSGLTDKIASDLARANGKSGAAQLTPAIVAANAASAIDKLLNDMRTQLAPVITAAGITDVSTFNPLNVAFHADHTGYDFVLDNTKVTVAADGSTQVAIAPTFKPPPPPPANTGPQSAVTLSSYTSSGTSVAGSVNLATDYSENIAVTHTRGVTACPTLIRTIFLSGGNRAVNYSVKSGAPWLSVGSGTPGYSVQSFTSALAANGSTLFTIEFNCSNYVVGSQTSTVTLQVTDAATGLPVGTATFTVTITVQ